MYQAQVNYLAGISFFVAVLATGCSSTSISNSLALLEQEGAQQVNRKVLMSIQALRASQKTTQHTYTFSYELAKNELADQDKMTIQKLLAQTSNNKNKIFINIAPATGANKLQQLSLSMARAKVLQHYITRFNKAVIINYAPELSIDTINLVVGA